MSATRLTVAVTGAAGFIGSNVLLTLAAAGHDVIAYDKEEPLDPYRQMAWGRALDRRVADLRKPGFSFDGCDYVIHLAADMGGVGYFHRHDFWPYVDNARMTMNVLDEAVRADVRRIFFASSACAYPIELQMEAGRAPLLEETMVEQGTPDMMYGREKLMMLRLAERAPIDARVGILHTVYGKGQERDGERRKFPPAAVAKALEAPRRGFIECWGDGLQLRSYLWIDDAVAKILRILFGPYDGPVNVGYEGAITCREVLALCAELAGVDCPITYTSAHPTGVLSRDCSNAKYRRVYGEMPLTGYREGFRMMMDWMQEAV